LAAAKRGGRKKFGGRRNHPGKKKMKNATWERKQDKRQPKKEGEENGNTKKHGGRKTK